MPFFPSQAIPNDFQNLTFSTDSNQDIPRYDLINFLRKLPIKIITLGVNLNNRETSIKSFRT